MKNIIAVIILIFLIIPIYQSNAQADTIMQLCTKYIQAPFISDGQVYKALLNQDEVAEFHATFYKDCTYRIVGCSGLSEGNLIFRVYDKERNLLFQNTDYGNTPYWNFRFKSTVDCIIEAQLDSKNLSSGFAIMLIGFKND